MKILVNTIEFRRSGQHFLKFGRYTKAPIGCKDWYDFWIEEENRCINGMTVGDISITGKHYFYLNYCPMLRKNKDSGVVVNKVTGFPAFWKIDYDWWWSKSIARFGATTENLIKLQIDALPIYKNNEPIIYSGNQHLVCVKTRRAGFSYKEAADGVYNYNFVPKSKNYFFAASEQYLTQDGILNKVQDIISHLNKHTDNWFLKNRHKNATLMHQKASYIDEEGNERGFMSEILGVIVDNPNKVRGKDGVKITYEEAGSFKNLKAALAISLPSIKDGISYTGQVSIFGTGGEEGESIEGLEDIYNNPNEYDMLAFNNIYEEGFEATECGMFVPFESANIDFMDADGNVDKKSAYLWNDVERDKRRRLNDPKELDRFIAEFPRSATEALSRIQDNIFAVEEVREWQSRLRLNSTIQSIIKHGTLQRTPVGIDFKVGIGSPVRKYPHKLGEDNTGCFTIYEKPFYSKDGTIPNELYVLVVDPFLIDDATTSSSLGAAYVIKREIPECPTAGDKIVASFIGRPPTLNEFIKNVFLLSDYYGGSQSCKIQSEILGGGQSIVDYAKMNKKIHYLEFEPEMQHNKELSRNLKNRSYFMAMPNDRKRIGLRYFADFLIQVRGVSEDGNYIKNLHFIYDDLLLEEIKLFRLDKNADRVSAMLIAMFMLKEKAYIYANKPKSENKSFYERNFYAENDTNQNFLSPNELNIYYNVA